MSGQVQPPLQKDHIVVSTVDQEPFLWQKDMKRPGEYSGYLKDIIDELALRLKFTYEIRQPDVPTMGRINPGNGQWEGIVGDVVNRVSNTTLGAGALTVTPQREEVVSFSQPFLTDSVNLLVYKPTWYDLGLGYLTRPFAGEYWIMVMVALLLIGLVFFVIGKFSPYEWGNVAAERDPRGARNAFSLRNSYLFALTTLTWQGFREAPRSLSGRIMAAFWWMFCTFTLIAYTANLTAFMLSRPEMLPDMPFKSYEDLLDNSDISVASLAGGSTSKRLYDSRDETLRGISTQMMNQNSYVDRIEDGVSRVRVGKGNFVYFMDALAAEYAARTDPECNMMIYGENLFPSQMAFAMPKASPWRTRINGAMADMKAEGLLDKIKEKYWDYAGHCENIDGRKFVAKAGYMSNLPIYPITLKDMAVAILFFFIGMIVAVICLIIEIVHYNVTKKGKKLHRPAIVKNPPKIWRPKGKGSRAPAAPAPADIEAGEADESNPFVEGDGEAGPSSDDAMESVPLTDDVPAEAEAQAEAEAEAEAEAGEAPADEKSEKPTAEA